MANEKKHFVVIGLGEFGGALSRQLSKNGCRVTGVDKSEARVEPLKEVLFESVIADATKESTQKALAIADYDAVIVSVGNTIVPSLLVTLHAREQGARRVLVKALDRDHAKLLKTLGVERVIFPKDEVAAHLGDQLAFPNIVDFIPIDPEYNFIEFVVPENWSGKSLADINIRRDYGVWVVGVKDALTSKLEMFPDGTHVLSDDQTLLLVGKREDVVKLRA